MLTVRSRIIVIGIGLVSSLIMIHHFTRKKLVRVFGILKRVINLQFAILPSVMVGDKAGIRILTGMVPGAS